MLWATRKDKVKNFSTILRINAICTRRDPTIVQQLTIF